MRVKNTTQRFQPFVQDMKESFSRRFSGRLAGGKSDRRRRLTTIARSRGASTLAMEISA